MIEAGARERGDLELANDAAFGAANWKPTEPTALTR